MANVHRINVKTQREELKQKRLTDMFLVKEKEKPLKMTGATDDKFILARRLIIWFCRDLIPLSSVENEGFKDFWHSVDSNTKLPTRQNISNNALDDVYKVAKEELIMRLKNSPGNQLHSFVIFSLCLYFHLSLHSITNLIHYFLQNTVQSHRMLGPIILCICRTIHTRIIS